MEIKTIDIAAKEYFDKVNANSYFSGIITLNFSLPDQKDIAIPYQLGYGIQYEYTALHQLETENILPVNNKTIWEYCRQNNILLRSNKKRNCLKSEAKNFIKYV